MFAEGRNEGVCGWHELEITETDDYAFIYISAVSGHILPKGTIPDGELQPFLAEVRRLVDASREER